MFIASNLWEVIRFRLARMGYQHRHPDAVRSPHLLLVNGSPKTGTTWVRMMLSAVPPYHPGPNFGGRIERYRDVQPGHVLHGHDACTPELLAILKEKGIGVVVTQRDPRDQAVSRMFHLRRDANHPYFEEFRRLDDGAALMAAIEGRRGQSYPGVEGMIRITQSWMSPGSGAFVVRYEELLGDPEKIMMSVFRYQRIPMDRRFLSLLVRYFRFERVTVGRVFWRRQRKQGQADPGSHFRKGIAGDWVNYFRPQHVQRFKEIAGDTLVEWGYEKDLDW